MRSGVGEFLRRWADWCLLSDFLCRHSKATTQRCNKMLGNDPPDSGSREAAGCGDGRDRLAVEPVLYRGPASLIVHFGERLVYGAVQLCKRLVPDRCSYRIDRSLTLLTMMSFARLPILVAEIRRAFMQRDPSCVGNWVEHAVVPRFAAQRDGNFAEHLICRLGLALEVPADYLRRNG